ncbi:MAG: single-stranded DNA-binding protein [Limnochordales bacterium]|nr:single-stranded DNA-binding protein [Limnochordales bacterium]
MFNKVILIGRLVADPQLRYTQTGKAVTSFRLAVDRGFASSGGAGLAGQERERQTDFFDIITWNKLAETCANYLGKGRLVAVEGRLQVRDYEGQDGQRRRAVEIVASDVRFLDSGRGQGGGAAHADDQGGDAPGFGLPGDLGTGSGAGHPGGFPGEEDEYDGPEVPF